MPAISTVNHKFNEHLNKARTQLHDMKGLLELIPATGGVNEAQQSQIVSRFEQIFNIIYNIPFMSNLPNYPQDAVFLAKKALRLMRAFSEYVRNINMRPLPIKAKLNTVILSTKSLIKELSEKTQENSSVDFAKAYEKILNKKGLMKLLGTMRADFNHVLMATRDGNRVDRLELSKLNAARNRILSVDKKLLHAIAALSSLVAEAARMQAYNERDKYMGILSDVKSERASIKNGINKIYNKKIKEVSERKKTGYEESLYGGKSGEFNRNAEFSERGRFGGLDIDSRSRLDRAIKRYIDKRVWAYVKNLSGI